MLRLLYRLLLNLLRLPLWPLMQMSAWLYFRRNGWFIFRVPDRLVWVRRPAGRVQRWLQRGRPDFSLFAFSRFVDALEGDTTRRELVLILPRLQCGWAMAQTLREELLRVREYGHGVTVVLPDGADAKELVIAGAAERVGIGPGSALSFWGIALERRYFGALLERFGVSLEVWRRGDFKTAADGFTREEMSEAEREQLERIAQYLEHYVTSSIYRTAEGEGDALATQGSLTAEEALEHGYVNAVVHDDEVLTWLDADNRKARRLAVGRYLSWRTSRLWRPLRRPPYIAVVDVSGTIRPERRGADWGRSRGPIQRIRRAAADKRARGVVLLIDSPGGSALTSEQIHREIIRAKESKPVVALFGNVAASGGYYIAAAADAIVSPSTCITGSIGVISAKPVMRELLGRLGVGSSVVKTRPGADVFSSSRATTEEESELFDRQLQKIYLRFLTVVSEGRGLSLEEAEAIAGGRVWTGQDALSERMIDRLGSRFEVAKLLAERLGISDGAVRALPWSYVGSPKSPISAPSPAEALALEALGWNAGMWELLRDEASPSLLALNLPEFRQ